METGETNPGFDEFVNNEVEIPAERRPIKSWEFTEVWKSVLDSVIFYTEWL